MENNRYQDNISPEPTIPNAQECYKTPNIQFTTNFVFNQLYPTPPSDNDETSHDSSGYANVQTKQGYYYATPNILNTSYYGLNPTENKYSNSTAQVNYNTKGNDNNTSFEENSQADEANKENESSQQVTNNRFKRRSRTTYTKQQLDTLEAVFQQNHYPEYRVIDDLSTMLNHSNERISIWFQNRRARYKKSRKLETHGNRFDVPPQITPIPFSYESNYGLGKSVQENDKTKEPVNNNYAPSYLFNQHKSVPVESSPVVSSNNVPNLTVPMNPASMPFYQPYSTCYYQNQPSLAKPYEYTPNVQTHLHQHVIQ